MSFDPQNPHADAPLTGEPTNPYAPTSEVAVGPAPVASDVEAYRRRYLNHEASVKSIGTLYMLGAIFMVPIGCIVLASAVFTANPNADPTAAAVIGVAGCFYIGLGLLQGFVAVGLRRLQNWARIVAAVLSVIGLLGFPIGTLISAYFLYLLLSEKGRIVCSDEYKQVIAQTPHIVYKTSIIVWILLILLLALIGFGIVAVIMNP
jgi:Trk-type K+ transport system membrane component